MQAAQAGSGGGKKNSTAMKRYGPIIGIVAVVIVGIIAVIALGGDDDDTVTSDTTVSTEAVETTAPASETTGETTATSAATSDPATTDAPDESAVDTTPDSGAPAGEVTYPMSFTQAAVANVDVDWGERCDTELGTIAVPDFFAAECYVPFDGDNGGETAQGVTADEITIAVYLGQPNDPILAYITDAIKVEDTNEQQADSMQNMVDYFETYYETYGRKVKLVFVEGTGIASDETAARADAVRVAEEIKPFMVWGGPALTSAFADELAANDISCISCTPGQPPEWYVDRDPLIWGIVTGAEQAQVHLLEMIQKMLIGKNAEHAGDEYVDQPRKFGLLYIESSATSKALADNFAAGMEANGAPFAERVAYQLDPGTIQQSASQAIAKFKAAGVTTIVFNGDPVAPRDFTKEATAQGYFPEWFIGSSALVDTNAFARTYDQEQWSHAFGYTYLAAKVDAAASGYYYLHTWFTGEEPQAKDTINTFAPYPAVFFAALQGVGPNLTHETWKQALFDGNQTRKALTQPSLGWGDKGIWPEADYVGIDDATMFWWDPAATGPDEIRREGNGMYQFVDGGARYLPGEWPTEDKFFDPEGAVTIYLERPADETPPDYPSPAG